LLSSALKKEKKKKKTLFLLEGQNLCQEISRAPFSGEGDGFASENSEGWEFRHSSGIQITGRIVFSVWRILRADLPVNIYTFENFVFHILHIRSGSFCRFDFSFLLSSSLL